MVSYTQMRPLPTFNLSADNKSVTYNLDFEVWNFEDMDVAVTAMGEFLNSNFENIKPKTTGFKSFFDLARVLDTCYDGKVYLDSQELKEVSIAHFKQEVLQWNKWKVKNSERLQEWIYGKAVTQMETA